MKENILDQEWDAPALLKFAFPTIVMMIFMGLYTITDTIFVARLVNADALSAINIVCPVINLTVGLGTMLAAGSPGKWGQGPMRRPGRILPCW